MYARVTRFEGSDSATMQQEIDGMRTQMESGLTDATSTRWPSR